MTNNETVLIIVIGVLLVLIIFLLVCAYIQDAGVRNLKRTRELEEKRVRDVESLLCKGWTISTERLYHGELRYWDFIAPDEKRSRILHEAVERQRKLDEIKKLNLPEVEKV